MYFAAYFDVQLFVKNARYNNIVVPRGRESGNGFRIPEIASDNSRFSFILFLYPQVVPSRSSERPSFLGADFRFWS